MFSTQADFERAVKDAKFFGSKTKTMQVFDAIKNVLYIDPSSVPLPHTYVSSAYGAYETSGITGVNGQVFELIIICLLIQRDITPVYFQTELTLIPHIDFDIVLYALDDPEFENKIVGKTIAEKRADFATSRSYIRVKPICISLKTSTRERFKQADLEAYVLKNVHRNAECYLVIRESATCESINKQIKEHSCLGLDSAIATGTNDFDVLIEKLCGPEYVFVEPKYMPAYLSGRKHSS